MSKKTTSNAFQQSAAQPPGSTPKRVKVTLACIVCRKKKVKCDGIQPSCSRCNSMGLTCEYSDPPRKRGPPKGYIEVIENRAHRIESLLVWHPQLRMQQPITDKVNTATTATTRTAAPSTTTTTTTIPTSVNSKNSQQPAITTTACIARDDHCLSAGPNALLNLVSSAVALHAEANNSNTDAPGSHDRQSDFSFNNELEWAESFFAHFNLFFPILSRQHFLHQLQHRPQEMDPLLRCAVLALGCRYAETQSHEDAGAQFFEQCQQHILNTTLSHDSNNNNNNNITLSTLQAVVIMCWYAYLSGDMQTCRTYLHKQVQLVKDLKLHRDPDLSLGIVTMELRRRAFWVAYVTNQWLACCTGSPLMMHQESYWDCRWPQLEDNQLQAIDSKKLTNTTVTSSIEYALQITVFAEMIKLARILDDHHFHSNSSSPTTTSSALTKWFLNLPSYLEYNQPIDHGPPSPIIRVYHMLYYTVQIMLHRASSDTLGVCNTAANTIVHIAEQMIFHQQERYLYNTYLLSLSLATSIHLDNAHKAPISLGKSIRVFKNANCTRLRQTDFDTAIDHYLKSQCHISLENDDEQFTQPPVVSKKRKRSADDTTKSERDSMTSKPSPSSKATTTTATTSAKDTMNELDINDLLGLTGLFDNTTCNNGNDWISHDWLTTVEPMINNQQQHQLEPQHQHYEQQQDFAFPTIETLSSSSGSLSSPTNSCFSPSHSPTLSCDNTSIVQGNSKNNQIYQTQFLAPYLDSLPLDMYAWADFIPGKSFDLME